MERGSVTAEFAMVLTGITTIVVLLVGFLSVGISQVRVSEAAAAAARSLARGDDQGQVASTVSRIAGDGVTTELSREGEYVSVRVTGTPTGLVANVLNLSFSANATALSEAQK